MSNMNRATQKAPQKKQQQQPKKNNNETLKEQCEQQGQMRKQHEQQGQFEKTTRIANTM